MNKIFFFLSIIVFTFSCKKEQDNFPIHVSGKVMDGATNLPLSNSTVRLYTPNQGYTNKTVTTDAQGYYSFDIFGSLNNKFEVSHPNYITSESSENLIPNENDVQNFDLKVYPIVYLDIKVKFVDATYGFMNASSWLNRYSNPHVFLSHPSDTIKHLILYKKGGTVNTFSIHVEKFDTINATTTTPVLSSNYGYNVYCNPSDTTFYTVQY